MRLYRDYLLIYVLTYKTLFGAMLQATVVYDSNAILVKK